MSANQDSQVRLQKSVVDLFAQWLLHFLCGRPFTCHQLVVGGTVTAILTPEGIAGPLRLIWMFDDDVAAPLM